MLTDPTRRPLVARRALSPEVLNAQPAEPFILDPMEFLTSLQKSRRGVAAGPSGMTSDHLFPVQENEGDSERLVEMASLLAMGRVPEEIIEALRLSRLTALSKPDGGVRGIVVGDILRMVARTIAKQIAQQVSGSSHCSLPVRPLNKSKMCVRCSHVALYDRSQSRGHRYFH